MRLTLRLFRAIFILSVARHEVLSRPLKSFQSVSPQLIVEFDASLFGGGILYYQCCESREVLLGSVSFSLDILCFGTDSTFQNSAEFITAIIGLIVAMKFSPIGTHVMFRGDSETALSWLETGKFRSLLITKVATVFIYSCLLHGFQICESQFLPAQENFKADYLSRHGGENAGEQVVNVDSFLSLLDPSVPMVGDDQYILFWNSIPLALNELLGSVQNTFTSNPIFN
jgi:hypothetical protein